MCVSVFWRECISVLGGVGDSGKVGVEGFWREGEGAFVFVCSYVDRMKVDRALGMCMCIGCV